MTVAAAPTVTSPALGAGEVGVAYDTSPVVVGGTGPYTWSVTGGSLPDGLSIDPTTGEITGTPTTSRYLHLHPGGHRCPGQQATQSESVTVATAPSVNSTALGAGEVGVAYDQVPLASGGTGPYTWSVTGGSLPDGLSIDPATGEISGTPTTSGHLHLHPGAHRHHGRRGHPGRVGDRGHGSGHHLDRTRRRRGRCRLRRHALGAGRHRAYPWSVTGGSLPDGLSIDPTTGEISGIPTTGGPPPSLWWPPTTWAASPPRTSRSPWSTDLTVDLTGPRCRRGRRGLRRDVPPPRAVPDRTSGRSPTGRCPTG